MENNVIAFLDSGIGGISVMKYFNDMLGGQTFIYLGDNEFAPYGNKTISCLQERTLINVNAIMQYKPKAIVVACNTLSANILPFIKEISPVPIIPIFPPLDAFLVKGEQVVLFCTELTAKVYIKHYIEEIEKGNLIILGLKNLAKDIENNTFSLEKINVKDYFSKNTYQDIVVNMAEKTLILGCTHYVFIKNKIFSHFYPQKIVDGRDYCFNEYKKIFGIAIKPKNLNKNQVIFIGSSKCQNQKFWNLVVKNSNL